MFKKIKKNIPIVLPYLLFAIVIMLTTIVPGFAANPGTGAAAGNDALKNVTNAMINVIEKIFIVIGIIITAFSAGQLVLAFKNEDADSKSRASTQLVVGIVLIGIVGIINSLGLTNYILDF